MRLRRHQSEALAAWSQRLAVGVTRGWVVLPPGSGKTLIGAEAVRRSGRNGVVFSPNTAIQGQWEATDPSLRSLTYQSLANFDSEGDGDSVVSRLHPNGLALIDQIAATPNLMVVLDECHHLVQVWGRLLVEVLAKLPEDALVLGLTATPPESMTKAETQLVAELFGEVTYSAPIPEVVIEGDLAPFMELAWMTTPTASERDWLAENELRLAELVTHLSDPSLASVSLHEAVANIASQPWPTIETDSPELADAILRLAYAGLTDLPFEAVLRERHRNPVVISDWIAIINAWLRPLAGSEDPRDVALLAEVAAVLPSIGYKWTRRGAVPGVPTADRVLARSAAKAHAAVEIVAAEAQSLGPDLRALVLCDYASASAVTQSLSGVLDESSGSAEHVLRTMLGDPRSAGLSPLLVTGKTVAGERETLSRLAEASGLELTIEPEEQWWRLVGWTPRQWVPAVTQFFHAGGTQALIGTRGLLGEGWDARAVNSLIDLTSATTATAVVQLRGRALRLDPKRPSKVSVMWSVACIADGLLGDGDWRRLVKKHRGYIAPDQSGELVDGVGHLDDSFTEHRVPKVAQIDELNVKALLRAERREDAAAAWRAGSPGGALAKVVRVRSPRPNVLGREVSLPPPRQPGKGIALPKSLVAALAAAATLLAAVNLWVVAAVLLCVALAGSLTMSWQAYRTLLEGSTQPAPLWVAAAVAEALQAEKLIVPGPESLRLAAGADEARIQLVGAALAEQDLFAAALDEALSPVGDPRYLVSRLVATKPSPWSVLRATLLGVPDSKSWHAVPIVLGRNASGANAYLRAWQRWVGNGDLLYTRSAEGGPTLRAVRGADPWQLRTTIRQNWAH